MSWKAGFTLEFLTPKNSVPELKGLGSWPMTCPLLISPSALSHNKKNFLHVHVNMSKLCQHHPLKQLLLDLPATYEYAHWGCGGWTSLCSSGSRIRSVRAKSSWVLVTGQWYRRRGADGHIPLVQQTPDPLGRGAAQRGSKWSPRRYCFHEMIL